MSSDLTLGAYPRPHLRRHRFIADFIGAQADSRGFASSEDAGLVQNSTAATAYAVTRMCRCPRQPARDTDASLMAFKVPR